MKNLHVFSAGIDFRTYPFKEINILTNPIDNATDVLIEKTKELLQTTKAINVILDSGGNTIFNRERGGKETIYDETVPIKKDGKVSLTPHHIQTSLFVSHLRHKKWTF